MQKTVNDIPEWMEKYIPAMMEQWLGNGELVTEIATKNDLIDYRSKLSDKSYGFPSKHVFDINMSIKISLLEIINRDFKLDSK